MSTSPNDIEAQQDDEPEADYTEETEGLEEPTEDLGKLDKNKFLLAVASDPQMQAVVQARMDGRKIKIVDDESEPEPEPSAAEESELEDVDDDLKKVIGVLDKRMSAKLEPLLEQVGGLQQLADGFQKQTVNSQIKDVSKRHKDFAKHRPAMAELAAGRGKGLSVEELYALAKLQAGELPLTEPSTHSERPTPTPRKKPESSKKAEPRRGRKGWNIALADALSNLDDFPH